MPSNKDDKKRGTNQLKLPAELTNLPKFIVFAVNQARQRSFTPQHIQDIELVIEEALVNVMEYAYSKQTGMITLLARPESQGRLVFEIKDQGEIFNPLDRETPDIESELMDRPVGGLGILLMKKLADELFWQRQDNENCLTIVFAERHV